MLIWSCYSGSRPFGGTDVSHFQMCNSWFLCYKMLQKLSYSICRKQDFRRIHIRSIFGIYEIIQFVYLKKTNSVKNGMNLCTKSHIYPRQKNCQNVGSKNLDIRWISPKISLKNGKWKKIGKPRKLIPSLHSKDFTEFRSPYFLYYSLSVFNNKKVN